MRRLEDYAKKYQYARFERRGGILQMTPHTKGELLHEVRAIYRAARGVSRWRCRSHNRMVILIGTGPEFSEPRTTPGHLV